MCTDDDTTSTPPQHYRSGCVYVGVIIVIRSDRYLDRYLRKYN